MPTLDPQALLNRLLQESTENSWIEFKQNNKNPEMIGKWISACANAAIISGTERAFLIYGIEDKTKNMVGTDVDLGKLKTGGENFTNWIIRKIEPRLMMEFLDFELDGKKFAIITVEPTYDRPVKFSGQEYIRIGENVKKLSEYPEHERSLWMATGRYKFESALAASHQTLTQVIEKLDVECFYRLSGEIEPKSDEEVARRFIGAGFIKDNLEGGYEITNLGAILFAKDIQEFPSLAGKSVRLVKYKGQDKRESEAETEGKRGYAVGFEGLMKYISGIIPTEEKYIHGVRKRVPAYPEIAVREIIANSLIHQDFTISGSGPVIEMYSDRLEVSNPGNSLIDTDRIIDERRSRNEKLASTMRSLGLCEERGGGLDKALFEIEEMYMPAPEFNSSENSMRVVIPRTKKFGDLTKSEKMRACFFHCVLRWMKNDYMSNSSLRARFSLDDSQYQVVSSIISESVKRNRITAADPNQGNRYARYVPYWARP